MARIGKRKKEAKKELYNNLIGLIYNFYNTPLEQIQTVILALTEYKRSGIEIKSKMEDLRDIVRSYNSSCYEILEYLHTYQSSFNTEIFDEIYQILIEVMVLSTILGKLLDVECGLDNVPDFIAKSERYHEGNRLELNSLPKHRIKVYRLLLGIIEKVKKQRDEL